MFSQVGGFLGLDKARERADGAGKLTLIGAGFSRTGTKSTEAALLELGHKIYDTRSILENNHADRWVDAAERLKRGDDGAVAALLAEMEAAGYTATLDFPMNLFGHSLAALRPDAKILFTTRNLDAWFASWYAVNDVLGIFVLRPWSWRAARAVTRGRGAAAADHLDCRSILEPPRPRAGSSTSSLRNRSARPLAST